MTSKLLEEAIAVARELPEDEQDVAADAMLSAIHQEDASNFRLTPEQVAEVQRIRRDLRDSKTHLATDDEMNALWSEFGL
jgi:hypothetical protein